MRALCHGRTVLAALTACSLLTFGLVQTSAAAIRPYDALYVFGDSLSDAGNLATFTHGAIPLPAFYPDGRFSNGLNYADDLATRLGLGGPLTPSLRGGTNFAWGSALTGNPPVTGLPPSLVTPIVAQDPSAPPFSQLGAFATGLNGRPADPHALYVVWGGANDLRDMIAYASANPTMALAKGDAVVTNAVDNIKEALVELKSAGAVSVLVPNLPDLGSIPETRARDLADGSFPLAAYATTLTGVFNADLSAMLNSFQGLSIKRLDVYSLFNDVLHNPVNYGFNNVTDPCFSGSPTSGGTVCGTPDKYLFWDFEHPTARTGEILGQAAFLAAVPEPRTYILFALGLLVLGHQMRRKLPHQFSRTRR